MRTSTLLQRSFFAVVLLMHFLATQLSSAQAGSKVIPLVYRQPAAVFYPATDSLKSGFSELGKGQSALGQRDYGKALLHYSKAEKLFSGSGFAGINYKTKYGIAQSCYFLGYYDKAIPLFTSCRDYYLESDATTYLNSLYYLGLSYQKNGEMDKSSLIVIFALDECKRVGKKDMEPYFSQLEGIINFDSGKYAPAIKKLEVARQRSSSTGDFANAVFCNYYIGMTYWMLKDKQRAVSYFKTIDTLSTKQGFLHPDFRPAYEKLIEQTANNTDRLYYINQLQKADLLFSRDYTSLFQKLPKQYTTAALQQMKRDIEKPGLVTFIIVGLLALVLFIIFYRYSKWQKHFIVVTDFTNLFGGETNYKTTTEHISPEVESSILSRLDKFERERQFLEREMTLAKMASLFNTNTRYVALVIVKHRGKGTVEYVNDLKIDLMVQLLKQQDKYRQYSQDALAEEVGFSTRQNFTKAFKERVGVSVGEFVKGL